MNLCDIWRVRNPLKKRFTFRQNHYSGFIQRRSDYFFISNTLQDTVRNTDVFAAFCSDHSPIFFSLDKKIDASRGRGLWTLNNSLTPNCIYIEKMKTHIVDTLNLLDNENILDQNVRWDFLKYEIRKFTNDFSKALSKNEKKEVSYLEKKLKDLECDLSNTKTRDQHLDCKNKLENIYTKKANGIRIRSKCSWYESGEKSSKFFLNLEKTRAKQEHLRKILVNENEIQEQREVDTHLYLFFKNLFTQKLSVCEENVTKFLDQISLPKLNNEQISECEGFINEEELFSPLKSMENDKSPGNDGLTKEFDETFWQDLKTPLLESIRHSYLIDKLTVSQNQAVIKLIGKKDRDKRFIKNWRPISLLNVDAKSISKALAERVKNIIPSLVSNNQIAYVNNRFISEGGRLISDIFNLYKLTVF